MNEDTEEYVKHRLPKRYYNMVGATMRHYYVAHRLAGNQVQVRFLRLPLEYQLPYEGYHKKLAELVERYLVAQHDTLDEEGKKSFAYSLAERDGIIGTHDFLTPSRVEFGYVGLSVRTSITKSLLSITDFTDILHPLIEDDET